MSLRTAASDPHTTPTSGGQAPAGPAGAVEQALGSQPPPGGGDELGDGALPYRRHLFGDQLHLTALVAPLQDADHAHPLALHRPGCGAPGLAGTLTSIWAARSRRVKKTHPPCETVGRYTSPSTATRPTRLRDRAISPARRTSVTCRAAPRAGSSHSFMLI